SRDGLFEDAERELDRLLGGVLGVLGDALVGIVDAGLDKAELVIAALREPAIDQLCGQPAPPAQLQQLLDVGLVDRDAHRRARQQREQTHLVQKGVPVAVLQRIEKIAVPDVEADGDADLQQGQGDQATGYQPRCPAFLRCKERRCEPEEPKQKPLRVGSAVMVRRGWPLGAAIGPRPAPGSGGSRTVEPAEADSWAGADHVAVCVAASSAGNSSEQASTKPVASKA